MNEITRFRDTVAITANSSAASTSGKIGFGAYAGGCIVVAATNGCTQVGWYASDASEGTPRQVYSDGAAVTTALTVGVHPIPDACFAAPFVVPVVTGGTTCAMTVLLKG
jgi:hypothetical protein